MSVQMKLINIFLTLLLILILKCESPNALKIVFSCPYRPVFTSIVPGFQANKSIGALAFALQEIRRNSTLLPIFTDVDIRYADSNCTSKDALGSLIALLEAEFVPDVIFGPLCPLGIQSAALLASKLNIASMTWMSRLSDARDKSLYSTLIRVNYNIPTFGDCVAALLHTFAWRTVLIISHLTLRNTAETIINVLTAQNYLVDWLPDQEANTSVFSIAKTRARIILLVVPEDDSREWMEKAYEEGMHTGEYVFILTKLVHVDNYSSIEWLTSKAFWQSDVYSDEAMRLIHHNLFVLSYTVSRTIPLSELHEQFNRSQWNSTWLTSIMMPEYPDSRLSALLYDTFILYAALAGDVQATPDSNINNGSRMFETARNYSLYDNLRGDITMDDLADRTGDFWLFDLQESGNFSVIAEASTINNNLVFNFSAEPIWGGGRITAPMDLPECGLHGEKCSLTSSIVYAMVIIFSITGVFTALVLVAGFSFVLIIRNYQALRTIKNWRVDYENVLPYNPHKESEVMMMKSISKSEPSSLLLQFGTVAHYKGVLVLVKRIKKKSIDITMDQENELEKLLSLNHPNVNVFMGACIDSPNICVLWEYGSKGSVRDVIGNDIISQLDEVAKFSITCDILQGLQYLHDYFGCHGNLKSSNVVIDGRWNAKLTDFGLSLFMKGQEINTDLNKDKAFSSLYWIAPEILLMQNTVTKLKHVSEITPVTWQKTETADMYSVGIIMKEIFCRNEPYEEEEDQGIPPKGIIHNILYKENFRPSLDNIEHFKEDSDEKILLVKELITSCWHPRIKIRPTAKEALAQCKEIQNSEEIGILDKMIENLEIYTYELEKRVLEDTSIYQRELQKVDDLLLTMVPRPVLIELKKGTAAQAEEFSSVSLLFSEIVGFSALIAKSSPHKVIDVLVQVQSLLDSIITGYDVYKIETVGDTYMIGSGIPVRNGSAHIENIADCALHVLAQVYSFAENNEIPPLKIGINTGPIIAGVIGLRVPRYCLFGETLEVTNKMMIAGKAMAIHMSSTSFDALARYGGYYVAGRGLIHVRGKGFLHTYWLFGKEGFSELLPSFKEQFRDEIDDVNLLPVTKDEVKALQNEWKNLKEQQSKSKISLGSWTSSIGGSHLTAKRPNSFANSLSSSQPTVFGFRTSTGTLSTVITHDSQSAAKLENSQLSMSQHHKSSLVHSLGSQPTISEDGIEFSRPKQYSHPTLSKAPKISMPPQLGSRPTIIESLRSSGTTLQQPSQITMIKSKKGSTTKLPVQPEKIVSSQYPLFEDQ